MKAILYPRYGPPDVLQLKEVAIPKLADHEVLVKLCAASVNPLDSGVVRGTGRLRVCSTQNERHSALISQAE
jgi:NADPH:quinone reductase-like Zn-dependent oxidoreductase